MEISIGVPNPYPAPDKIRFRCPQCDAKLAAPPDRAGAQIPCPKCEKQLTVPAAEPSARSARETWSLARCPDCDDVLKVANENFGVPVSCPSCDSHLIVSTSVISP